MTGGVKEAGEAEEFAIRNGAEAVGAQRVALHFWGPNTVFPPRRGRRFLRRQGKSKRNKALTVCGIAGIGRILFLLFDAGSLGEGNLMKPVVASVLMACCLSTSLAFAAEAPGKAAATRKSPARNPTMNTYPIQVHLPTIQEITQSLDRLLERAKAANPAVIVDRETNQPITDFSKVNPNARIVVGGYTFGVLHAAMLMATDATGDKRFADFTNERMKLISDHYDYFARQAQEIGLSKCSFKNFLQPANLDACGAWGAAVVMAKRAGLEGGHHPADAEGDRHLGGFHQPQAVPPAGWNARPSPAATGLGLGG